ncbi:hypothetical protein T265_08433 [Opisthorchis viverrini]|uniref:Uncharacterized protein n=1 Tax=Opisthorchis viverrini TaxID=6198 RepID=A0A074ZDP5_OPIVI|nr:hypothetical protein T265_08433 [Opisthorchis viverrini]KER23742.1 hypothetical protein T265_08433 [Opisthorchis viverrini]
MIMNNLTFEPTEYLNDLLAVTTSNIVSCTRSKQSGRRYPITHGQEDNGICSAFRPSTCVLCRIGRLVGLTETLFLSVDPWCLQGGEMPSVLGREFTDRKVRGSNPTSASRLPQSRLGQPGSIPTLVLPHGGIAGATAEQWCLRNAHTNHIKPIGSNPDSSHLTLRESCDPDAVARDTYGMGVIPLNNRLCASKSLVRSSHLTLRESCDPDAVARDTYGMGVIPLNNRLCASKSIGPIKFNASQHGERYLVVVLAYALVDIGSEDNVDSLYHD